jgi:[ribosomal protein S18]-alanine N-acetyltransferase
MGDHANEVTIRPGRSADLDAIRQIQSVSGMAAQWDPADYLNYDLTVAERGSRVVAFIVTRAVASDEKEILNLAVHPDFHRLGIAIRLLRHVVSRCSSSWFLEVRASNSSAIGFYQSAGFQAVGVRSSYYSQPDEDAVVMRMGS